MSSMKNLATTAERTVRRIAGVIIVLFLIAMFAIFVGPTVFGDPSRTLRFLGDMSSSPAFWAIIAGPITFWAALIAMSLRLPRETRSAQLGTLGSHLSVAGLLELFVTYRARFGFGPLLWTVVLSGTITAALLWLVTWGMEERPTAWLVFISALWLAFAIWLLFFSHRRTGRRARSE